MNLVLHQFNKEFRYLWPRWLVFLAALLADLAFNMEWILPLDPEGVTMVADMLFATGLWIIGWWVALSTAPEDEAEGGAAFVRTRPLPRHALVASRGLVWLVLIMLPMTLETGLYLTLQHRPWSDVGLGMAEELWATSSMAFWVIPAALLFRGWEIYMALVVFFAVWGASYGRTVVDFVFEHLSIESSWRTLPVLEPARFIQAAWWIGPAMVLLLLWHQRHPWHVVKRLSAFALLLLITYGLAVSPLAKNPFDEPLEQPQIQQLAQAHTPVMRAESFRFTEGVDDQLRSLLNVSAAVEMDGLPRDVMPFWTSSKTIITQNGRALPMLPPEKTRTNQPHMINLWLFEHSLSGALNAGGREEILAMKPMAGRGQFPFSRMEIPQDLKTPVDVDMHLTAVWARLRELGRAPLQAGARILSPEAELEVLEVRKNVGARGESSPGQVTLLVRQSMRTLSDRHAMWPAQPLLTLHAPGKKLLWQNSMQGRNDWRAMRLGWVQMIMEMTFGEVLKAGTGVTEQNLGSQQLVWMKPDYLGTSRHHVQVKDVSLQGNGSFSLGGLHSITALHQRENPRARFLAAVRQRRAPSADAPIEEAARYVASVYTASAAYDQRRHQDPPGQLVWPGDDREVADLVAPFLLKHPELVQRLNFVTESALSYEIMRSALVLAGVPGFERRPGQPIYQRAVVLPDWPGATQKFESDLWLTDVGNERMTDAVVEMLKTRSDDPMRAVLRSREPSLEKAWRNFSARPAGKALRYLCKDPAYREKAAAEVSRQYGGLGLTVRFSDRELRIIIAQALMGDSAALSWGLRAIGLSREVNTWESSALLEAHESLFGQKITHRQLPQFIRDCRAWTPESFRYDAEKMLWVPQANQ
ncbi:MAG: hypothetical protein V4662_13170 [Verrucomicrobiota bacterium]